MNKFNVIIRTATLVLAMIFIVTSCSKQNTPAESKPNASQAKSEPPMLVEPNAGVGKVRKGMDKQQVEAELGQPKSKNGMAWYYSRQGILVSFGKNDVMFNIKCVKPFAGATKEGIGIGSTRADLIKAYGNPSETKQFANAEENLWFAPIATSFYLEKGKITSFIVHLNSK